MKVLRVLLIVLVGAVPFVPTGATGATTTTTVLDGRNEVPSGSGDPNGEGDAAIVLKAKRRQVCWTVNFDKIDAPHAGHIHEGAVGVDGPIVVALFTQPLAQPIGGSGCVRAPRGTIRNIAKNPSAFYVNLHNAEYPDGAIRGQLS